MNDKDPSYQAPQHVESSSCFGYLALAIVFGVIVIIIGGAAWFVIVEQQREMAMNMEKSRMIEAEMHAQRAAVEKQLRILTTKLKQEQVGRAKAQLRERWGFTLAYQALDKLGDDPDAAVLSKAIKALEKRRQLGVGLMLAVEVRRLSKDGSFDKADMKVLADCVETARLMIGK